MQHQLERVRFLSRRFHELQGLRVAWFGATMAVVLGGYLIASASPATAGVAVALLASAAIVIPGHWWLGRYFGVSFVAIGLLDHWLLVRLMQEARAQGTAVSLAGDADKAQ